MTQDPLLFGKRRVRNGKRSLEALSKMREQKRHADEQKRQADQRAEARDKAATPKIDARDMAMAAGKGWGNSSELELPNGIRAIQTGGIDPKYAVLDPGNTGLPQGAILKLDHSGEFVEDTNEPPVPLLATTKPPTQNVKGVYPHLGFFSGKNIADDSDKLFSKDVLDAAQAASDAMQAAIDSAPPTVPVGRSVSKSTKAFRQTMAVVLKEATPTALRQAVDQAVANASMLGKSRKEVWMTKQQFIDLAKWQAPGIDLLGKKIPGTVPLPDGVKGVILKSADQIRGTSFPPLIDHEPEFRQEIMGQFCKPDPDEDRPQVEYHAKQTFNGPPLGDVVVDTSNLSKADFL